VRWRNFDYDRDVVNQPTIRYVKKFAFLPTKVEGNWTVWLEIYQSFQRRSLTDTGGHKFSCWFETEKLLKEVK